VVIEPVTDGELRLARQGALSAARSARGLVSSGELIQEANVWMMSHLDKVELWREQGRHGQNKLRHACKQWCLLVVARERKRVSRLEGGDLHYYTDTLIAELLPHIWDPDDWATGEATYTSERKAPARPAEGNNRLAMVCDVRQAFFGLPVDDRQLLEWLHRDGGASYEAVGVWMEVSDRTVRRREERVLAKMVERLGGEPPWK
jgi:DNA-directed RNA polymerase specialized sigma24 family protein